MTSTVPAQASPGPKTTGPKTTPERQRKGADSSVDYEDDYEAETADEESSDGDDDDDDDEEEEDAEEEEEDEAEEEEEDDDDDDDDGDEEDEALEDPIVLKVQRRDDPSVRVVKLANDIKLSVFLCEVAAAAGIPSNTPVDAWYVAEGSTAEHAIVNKKRLGMASKAFFDGASDYLRVIVAPKAPKTALAAIGKAPQPQASGSITSPSSIAAAAHAGEFSRFNSSVVQSDSIRGFFEMEEHTTMTWTEMKVLGSGAFGKVVEALTSTGKLIAVKHLVIPADAPMCCASSSEDADELIEEIKLLKQLHHPHIVEYYGCQTAVNEEDGTRVIDIFLEHCHGGSINTLRRKFDRKECRLSVALARTYTRQVVEGLTYLHAKGVVHRDIKGDNVLISGSGDAKLADFGCSKKVGTSVLLKNDESGSPSGGGVSGANMKTLVGTPLFMAPEVMKEEAGGYTAAADIWSIGCLVIELFGRQPWVLQGTSLFAIMYAVATSKTPPTGLPDEFMDAHLRAFLLACFDREPERRPTAAQLLGMAWLTCPESELEEPRWGSERPGTR
jgi:hypothetical protein